MKLIYSETQLFPFILVSLCEKFLSFLNWKYYNLSASNSIAYKDILCSVACFNASLTTIYHRNFVISLEILCLKTSVDVTFLLRVHLIAANLSRFFTVSSRYLQETDESFQYSLGMN